MLTAKQKEIYNKHLIISRKSRNKPFKPKENFSDVTAETSNYLHKIDRLLSKFPNIDLEVYFKAPYMLWPDTEYFPLQYFATQAAIRAFTVYRKNMVEQNIDSDQTIKDIKDSLIFIGKFCVSNKITLQQYFVFRSGITYAWMSHVRKGLISPYVIFGFDNIDNLIFSIPEDERDLMLGSFQDKYYNFKESYNKSKIAKNTIVQGLSRIKEWVTKELGVENNKT